MLNATPVEAQFQGGWSTRGFSPIPPHYFNMPGVMPVQPLMGINRFNPLMFNPLNQHYSPQRSNAVQYYSSNRNYYGGYSAYPSLFSPGYSPYVVPTSGGYMSGTAMQRDFGRAQAEAATKTYGARQTIIDQGAIERRERPKPGADDRQLGGGHQATTEIASGAALNRILAAAIAIDHGEKLNSAFLAPNLLTEVQFTGGDAALTMFLAAGHLPFPSTFDSGPLAELKPRIEKDFSAAIAPLLAGKPCDPTMAAKLESTLQKTRKAMTTAAKDFDFQQTTTVRFLNQLDAAAAALKKPETAGALVPHWGTEGTSVAELARHMAKFKLQFAPAGKSGEEAYVALHRALGDYLIALLDRNAPAKKP